MNSCTAILLAMATAALFAMTVGCASSGGSSRRSADDYYGRGTVHQDSYPYTYGRGGAYGYGRYGRPVGRRY